MTLAEATGMIDGHERNRRALAWQIAALKRTRQMPDYRRYVDPPPLPSREKQRETYQTIKARAEALPPPRRRRAT